MEKVNLSSDKFKCTQDSTKYSCSKDIIYGCSWHQRNYKCSFCKKEFNSAQALGGHMNVHRRDRAKMRLSPSCDQGLNQNPKPNTNPNPYPTVLFSLPSPSPASKFLPQMTLLSSVTEFSSPSSASTDEEKLPIVEHSLLDPASHRRGDIARNLNKEDFFQVEELTSSAKKNESRVWKKREMVRRLGFDMDLHQDAKEDLDLELRLGYA